MSDELVVGGADEALDAALSKELGTFNDAATQIEQRELTIAVRDDAGQLVAGISGWTWGTCAGIAMLWVHADHRGERWGSRLMRAAEDEARRRGCLQMTVSSFTFQAPGFYERQGYVEQWRLEGLPVEGSADVYFRKALGQA